MILLESLTTATPAIPSVQALLVDIGIVGGLALAYGNIKNQWWTPFSKKRDTGSTVEREVMGYPDPVTNERHPSLREKIKAASDQTNELVKAVTVLTETVTAHTTTVQHLSATVQKGTKEQKALRGSVQSLSARLDASVSALTAQIEHVALRVGVVEQQIPTLATSSDLATVKALAVEVAAIRDELLQLNVKQERFHRENRTVAASDQHMRTENTRSIDDRLDRLSSVLEHLLARREFSDGTQNDEERK